MDSTQTTNPFGLVVLMVSLFAALFSTHDAPKKTKTPKQELPKVEYVEPDSLAPAPIESPQVQSVPREITPFVPSDKVPPPQVGNFGYTPDPEATKEFNRTLKEPDLFKRRAEKVRESLQVKSADKD